jgi:hypothetical protein
MGRREETQGLLAHEPESMGRPEDEYAGEVSGWRERLRRRIPYVNGRNCKLVLLALILLILTAGFLVAMITSVKEVSQPGLLSSIPGPA